MSNKEKSLMLRTDIRRSSDLRVDREKGLIFGFVVVQEGITHDRRGEFDSKELDNIINLGNDVKMGLKSRFGHPNMSSTALGTFLGRASNFRRDKDLVRADLKLDESAFQTPDGDLASYIMSLAESDPEAFGASMVIRWEAEFKQKIVRDDDGKDTGDKEDDFSEPPFIRVKKLFAVDAVDDPAATNAFFGESFFTESVKPSAEITKFLDSFFQDPLALEKAESFMKRYLSNANNEKFLGLKTNIEEILDLYAEKRRGGVENSFEGLIEQFQKCFSSIQGLQSFNKEDFSDKPFASELFEKIESLDKIFSNFTCINQWWKPKFLENKTLNNYIISTDNKFDIYIDKNILNLDMKEGEAATMYFKPASDLIKRFNESIEFIGPEENSLNKTTMPSWIKQIGSGNICIKDISQNKKTFEIRHGNRNRFFEAIRKNCNDDFWEITLIRK